MEQINEFIELSLSKNKVISETVGLVRFAEEDIFIQYTLSESDCLFDFHPPITRSKSKSIKNIFRNIIRILNCLQKSKMFVAAPNLRFTI